MRRLKKCVICNEAHKRRGKYCSKLCECHDKKHGITKGLRSRMDKLRRGVNDEKRSSECDKVLNAFFPIEG